MPLREQNSNKGTFGKILNIAGSKNYIGAAYLSTVATLKTGAGFCTLASTPDVIRSVSCLLPEAVYLERKNGINNIKNFSVVLIGCGLGDDKKSFCSAIKRLQKETTPIVIDADGLNILSKIKIKLPQNTIITPHPLEAARLLGVSLEEILSNLELSAKKLCSKYDCTTVLKTHRTIICNKEKLFINQHGNSALAKAGTGDVLTGIIGSLLSQGLDLFEAAKLGVYLHSRAGEIASQELTEYSVLASELPNYIPLAIKEINSQR